MPELYLKKLALEVEGDSSTERCRKEAFNYIRAFTLDPDLTWGRVADDEVPCIDGVLNIHSGRLRQHAPEDCLERVVPWLYSPKASCPAWDQCLIDWFGDDELGAELIAALQEFFGYVCLSHARFKKALLLHGDSDTGKSQVVHILQHLVGTQFTCQLSVEHMDDPVMRAVIKGKALNVMTEVSSTAMIADGGFKALVSTEEPILLNEKYKPPEMYTPTAKHVIATNNLPAVNDKTAATYNRMLLVPMLRVIAKEEQDRALKANLVKEMEGILVWAIEGARRLLEHDGEWPEPARSRQMLAEYRAEQNPVVAFVEECAEEAKYSATPMVEVTRQYNEWNQGSRRSSVKTVGRMLRDAGFETGPKRYGKRVLRSLKHYRLLGQPSSDPGGWNPEEV